MTSQAIPRGHHPGPRKGEVLDAEPKLGAPCGFQCQDKTQWETKKHWQSSSMHQYHTRQGDA
jgi:hypothetical protein